MADNKSIHSIIPPHIQSLYENEQHWSIYSRQGRHHEALDMYNKSLSIILPALGVNHPEVGKKTKDNMAITPLVQRSQYNQSTSMAKRGKDNHDITYHCQIYKKDNVQSPIVGNATKEVAIPLKEIEIKSASKLALTQYYCSSIIDQRTNKRNNNQYVKIWNFGGHAIYHVNHSPLISANSIYIVVFNMNQDINDKGPIVVSVAYGLLKSKARHSHRRQLGFLAKQASWLSIAPFLMQDFCKEYL
ncbi:hypothetical protein TrispH2_010192 [Trichoplax sp. H2]|nr:hypothetical protein TrispH2_010192 [Trichoplax sp. H2]|eukprot:RDD38974.1 hypothetical protein TrispH2_010192 [Trichoplax sp. H2]